MKGDLQIIPATLAEIAASVRRLSRTQKVQLLGMIGQELLDDREASVVFLPGRRYHRLVFALMPSNKMKSWDRKDAQKNVPSLDARRKLAKHHANFRTIREMNVDID